MRFPKMGKRLTSIGEKTFAKAGLSVLVSTVFCIKVGWTQTIPLTAVFKEIEKHSDLTFNYDPDQLASFRYDGPIQFTNPQQLLEKALFATPFEFQINDRTVLIFLAEPTPIVVCGRVQDASNLQPLPFANLYAANLQNGVSTNEEGYFNWSLTAAKNEEIRISFVGYTPRDFMVQEFRGGECVDVLLTPDPTLWASTVVVEDYLLDGIVEGEGYGSVDIRYDQLTNWQSNIEHDILKTAQLIPGINSVDESATNLSIRGSSADQNLVLWEGAKLYDPGHLFGMISSVNPFVVRDVKIFKGVFEPSYDNVVGGIIDLSLSDSIATGFGGGLGSTFTEAHGYFNGPIIKEKVSILLAGRNSINGIFQSPTLQSYSAKVFQDSKVADQEEEDIPAEQLLNFYDWNAKLLFRPHDHLFFKTSYFKSGNRFNYFTSFFEDELDSNDNVQSESEALSTALYFELAETWQSKLFYSRSKYASDYLLTIFDVEDDAFILENDVSNGIVDQTLGIASEFDVFKNGHLNIGYEFNQKMVRLAIRERAEFEPGYEENTDETGHFHNAYASLLYEKKDFLLNVGWRAILYRENGTWSFSPRLNLQRSVNDQLKLKFSAGILHQYIGQLKEFGENDLQISNQVWILNRISDEEFATQRADKISAGILFRQGGLMLDIDAYYHKISGLNTFSPQFGEVGDLEEFLPGSATARGIDLLLKKKWGAYQLWTNYSLSDVYFSFPEVQEVPFPATNAQRHILALVNNWKYKNWNFSITYQFKSGLPFSEPTEVIRYEEEEELFYEIYYEDLNSERLDYYSRVDIGATYRHTFKHDRMRLEAAFSIINLFDRDNIFNRNYFLTDLDEVEETPEVLFVDKFLLGRTPQLLLRLAWQ